MQASAAPGLSVPSGPRCAAGGATARPRTCRTGTRVPAGAPQPETVHSGRPPAPSLDTAELMVLEEVQVVVGVVAAGLKVVVVELEVVAAIVGVPVVVEGEEVEEEEQQEVVEVEPLQEEVEEVVRVEARASVEGTPTVLLMLPTAPSGATAGPRLGTPVIV